MYINPRSLSHYPFYCVVCRMRKQSVPSQNTRKGGGRRNVSLQQILYDWLLEETRFETLGERSMLTRDGFEDWARHNLTLVWGTDIAGNPILFDSMSTCYVHTDPTSVVAGNLRIFLRKQLATYEGKTQLENLTRADREPNVFMLLGLLGTSVSTFGGIKKGRRGVIVFAEGNPFNPVVVDVSDLGKTSVSDMTDVSLKPTGFVSVTASTVSERLRPLPSTAKPPCFGRNSQPKSSTASRKRGWIDREEEPDSDFSADSASDDEPSDSVWVRESGPVGGGSAGAPGPGPALQTGAPTGQVPRSMPVWSEIRKRFRTDTEKRVGKPVHRAPGAVAGPMDASSAVKGVTVGDASKGVIAGGAPRVLTGVSVPKTTTGGAMTAGQSVKPALGLVDPLIQDLMQGMPVFATRTRGYELAQVALASVRLLRAHPAEFQGFLELADLADTRKKSGGKVTDKTRDYSWAESEVRKLLKTIADDRAEKCGAGGPSVDDSGDRAVEEFLAKFGSLHDACDPGVLSHDLFLACCKTLREPLLIMFFVKAVSEHPMKGPIHFPERALAALREVVHDVRLALRYPDTFLDSGGYFDPASERYAPFENTDGFRQACSPGLKETYVKQLNAYETDGLPLSCARYLAWCDLAEHPEYLTVFIPAFNALPKVVAWDTRNRSAKPHPRELIIFQYQTCPAAIVVKEEPRD